MFACIVCSRSFTRQDNLKRHMNDHNNLKFSRAECTREFMIKGNLATHQKT
ncbi:Zinc finger C2H2-type,Zinc finger, RING/FYVE/PHD-type, partial [Cinara cedri]